MAGLYSFDIIINCAASPNVTAAPVIAGLIYINKMVLELPDFFLDIYGTKTK
jgi:hypothetical protein